MNFVFLQYPPVWLLFAFSAIFALLSRKFDFPAAVVSAVCGIAGILAGLICALPLEEILLLLLVCLLCATGKGDAK